MDQCIDPFCRGVITRSDASFVQRLCQFAFGCEYQPPLIISLSVRLEQPLHTLQVDAESRSGIAQYASLAVAAVLQTRARVVEGFIPRTKMRLNIEGPIPTVSAISALESNNYPRCTSFYLRAYRRVRDRSQVLAFGDVIQA